MSSKKPIRRSALLGPWGVGAIVPFADDETLMIAGLDEWDFGRDSSQYEIDDPRLKSRLHVNSLRIPPDFHDRETNSINPNMTIPAIRFPTWYYCPNCGLVKQATYYQDRATLKCDAYPWTSGRVCKPNYRHNMIPERFVVVCAEGHINDLPIAEWVHYDYEHPYNESTCVLRRSTGGTSASLTGVYYECTCGAKRSLGGINAPNALYKRIGYRCTGAKPWLGIKSSGNCDAETSVVLRGATNVWFAETVSSIYIPNTNEDNYDVEKLKGIIRDSYDKVKDYQQLDLIITILQTVANMNKITVSDDVLKSVFLSYDQESNTFNMDDKEVDEDEYRFAEYKVLIKSSGNDQEKFYSKNFQISEYDEFMSELFNSITLVPKMCETRALVGFSRLVPNNKSIIEKRRMLSNTLVDWVPAIQVFGEGIFFDFNAEKLKRWAKKKDVVKRISILNKAYKNSKYFKGRDDDLKAEYVLIHTFAHLIINQLSYECGYGSSSLRERIYCEKDSNNYDCYGVLIYTASGDSEGSMGGLVRQGKPGRLEEVVVNAIRNAEWCSSDPVCSQSSGQGPESLNLAACYNCALLPETCCENGNRLLDRCLVVGTLENREMGFFSNVLNNLASDE